jgi:hypothetical protein
MPTLQVADDTKQERSLFLVSGSLEYISHPFIRSIIDEFKLIVLNNPQTYTANENLFQVHTTAANIITKLSERIEYAVFFISSKEDKKILENLVPKLEKDHPKTLILFPVKDYDLYSDILILLKGVPTIMFGLIGEVFGNSLPTSSSYISAVINQAIKEKTIGFMGNELVPVFPISQADALKAIAYLLFSRQKSERVYFLFYEHPQTLISTIHILKRIEPDLQITQDTTLKQIPYLKTHKELINKIGTQPLLQSAYVDEVLLGFEKGIKNITTRTSTKQTKGKKKTKINSVPKNNVFKRSFISLMFFSVLLFLICNVVLTLLGVVFAKNAMSSLNTGNFTQAKQNISYANKSFELSSPVISGGFKLVQLLPIPSLQDSYETFVSGVTLTKFASEQFAKIETIENGIAQEDLLDTLAVLSYLYFSAQSSPEYQRLPHIEYLTSKPSSNVLTTLSVLPKLMGYESEKRYLLLFQNNGELRPTGGFIGSVGELFVKNGRVEELTIQDVYDIDGQIKTHTEPPYIVRRYLQPHLFLRDSNFSLDFQEAATTAAFLYKEGGGNKVDGVIALDYTVLQKILEITGPIYLPSHNKTIDSQSGFEFIQSTIEETFTPGASQKKSILSEVFNQLLLKFRDPKVALSIAKNLPDLIEEKHILFALKDPSLQDIFTKQKFAGSINSQAIGDTNVLSHYLSINEANIGVNKANIHVSRTISLSQKITENSLLSSATVSLDNSKGKEAYKTYIRFLTPQNTSFEDLLINGKITNTTPAITNFQLYEAPSFTPPSAIELTEEIYQNKKVYGLVYTIPAGKREYISLQYAQNYSYSKDGFIYDLSYQPQPGILPTPFTLSLEFPDTLIARDKESGTVAQKKLSTSHVIKKDVDFQIEFDAK